ncbi:MAG: arsenic resistance N-acetyltransferase ArsN2, partial [Sphingobacteriales bacterium]
ITLLESEKLPAFDLPEALENFAVVVENDEVIGVAGLETYGNYGLLRSLAVLPGFRGNGVAGNLIRHVESLANAQGLNTIYLLTETALEYFKRKGYKQITRANIPAEVQRSSEFSYACPQSAIAMMKPITTP